jgi:hypothetical protein
MLSLEAYRRIVILGQIAYGTGGIAVSVFGLVLLLSAPLSIVNPISLEIGELVLGVVMLCAAIMGILAAVTGKPVLFVAYGLLLATILIASAFGYSNTLMWGRHGFTHKRFSNLWDRLDDTTVLQVQDYGQCCGFDSYTDRIQEPCKRFREQVGCYDTMAGFFKYQLNRLRVPALMVMVVTCLVFLATAALFWFVRRQRRQDKRKLIPDRQPFDAWHKAVFQ